MAVLALLLGILSIPISVVFGLGIVPGPLAIILGARARALKKPGKGVALMGMSFGFIGTGTSALVLITLFSTIVLPRITANAARASIGTDAPFDLTSLSGTELDFGTLKGKRVVVDVWATWCGPCIATIPALDQLALEDDVVVMGISFEDPEHVREWITRRRSLGQGPNYSIVAADRSDRSKIPATFANVSSLPTIFILDGTGVIRDVQVGQHSFDRLKRAVMNVPLMPKETTTEETTQ